MSAFPWNNENVEQQRARVQYAESLKAQMNQRQEAAALKKQQEREAERLDDLRVEREAAVFQAQAQQEIQAQRDREARVAQREALAREQFTSMQQNSREEKLAAFQRAREAQLNQEQSGEQAARAPPGGKASIHLGDDGTAHEPLPSSRRSAAVLSQARLEAEAGLARAAASGVMRPDQEADSQAAAIRRRHEGSSVF